MEDIIKYEVSAWKNEEDSFKDAPRMMKNYSTLKQAKSAAQRAANRFGYVEINKVVYDSDGYPEKGYLADIIINK